MYRIVIVDDEKFIRKSIRNRMKWEMYGIEVAGEASNGQKALEQIRSVRPQIVLVDIRMPVMDGLAFVSEAKRRYPQIHYIMMSAYSDFEYAQKAIRLGVEDYILKPVKPAELEKVLNRITHTLNQKRLESHLLQSVEGSDIQSVLHGSRTAALVFYAQGHEEAGILLERAMEEAFGKMGGDRALYYLKDFSAGDCYVFLMNGDRLTEEDCRRLAEAVWDQMGDMEGVAAFAEVMESSMARRAVRDSITLLIRKIFYPEKKILTVRQRADAAGIQRQKDRIREEMNCLYQPDVLNDCCRMENIMSRVISLAVDRRSTVWTIESTIAELIVLLKKMNRNVEDETDYAIMFNGLQGKNFLLRYQTEAELRNRLLEAVHNSLSTLGQSDDADVILAIKQYIRENYQSDLNAAETARRFYLNASYLSTLFKEKTGMNMGAYIEGVRMEKAGQFLQDTDCPVTEAAIRCGYSDSNYFSKVFKRYTGMTPRQYRESAKGQQRFWR